ncbi:MAG: NTP transferase domain-containing protein [Oscillospiraceae bacterium]|jgi:CTP:molybdopterin cytidylyltransferase MocA|nr:NTP transferase domain-containing protein [Oscillospiraceae bacterium]
MKFAAVILAAGLSSRMGALKPVLPVGGERAVERAQRILREAGVSNIVMVTGHRRAEVERFAAAGTAVAYNAEYASGMFSSVRTGVAALGANFGDDYDAFFMLPADCCVVPVEVLRQVADAYAGSVVYPMFGGKRGHPPLIPRSLADGLLRYNGDGGTKGYLAAFHGVEVETGDARVLLDMDTPQGYADVLRSLGLATYPDDARCAELLANTPEDIVRHGREVRDLAVRLASELNARGAAIDVGLLASSALLHDIARAENDHAAVAAARLLELGYPDASRVVATHMDLPDGDAVGEAELLYLADKLSRSGEIVAPQATLDALIARFGADSEAASSARVRMARAEAIIGLIKKRYGFEITFID